MERKLNCSCSLCGSKMYRRPSQLTSGRVYCSRSCHGIAQRFTKECPVCGKSYWGTKQTCSRACANKRRTGTRYLGENKNNKAFQGWFLKEKLCAERGGKCEMCGYENYNILQIHHIIPKADGGTDESRNLMILCPNCHMEEHHGYGLYGGSSR